jgi:hypothetical protein
MPAITIVFGEMTPVDKMSSDDDGRNCPLPTKDPELNAQNKEKASRGRKLPRPGGQRRIPS